MANGPAPATLAADATKAQALAYLSANFKNTYHNAAKTPYEGKNAAQLYAYVEQHNPGAKPHDIAVAVADLLLSSAVGSGIGTGATEGLTGINDFAQAAANGANYLPSLTSLLSALTSAALWIRVAKVVVGGTLLLVGIAHITGAGSAVATVARKVPLPV